MRRLIFIFSAYLYASFSYATDISGEVGYQSRYFMSDSEFKPGLDSHHSSINIELDWYHAWDEHSINFKPFIRADAVDHNRSHGDIRELYYQRLYKNWEVLFGISKVFWGVTESQHLVDIINQTDLVENIDTEDKLGQPMLKFSYILDNGSLDLFILPYFRERTFYGADGRPRLFGLDISNNATYESSDKEKHLDYAIRWFNYLGELEFGLSLFDGTDRSPLFINTITSKGPVLIPLYPQLSQFGLDAQYTSEDWLWKLEYVYRQSTRIAGGQLVDDDYYAYTAGIEYTFVGIFNSDMDLGWVFEHLYDSREDQATSLFQNDLMSGLRLAVNDEASSEALLGIIYDLDYGDILFSIEAATRLMSNWTANLEVRLFNSSDNRSPVQIVNNEDLIQLDFNYHF